MKILFALLILASAAAFAGALALIIYRQNAMRALQGHKTAEYYNKIRDVLGYLKAYIVKINLRLVKNNRYRNITGMLVKINYEDKISPEYFLFIEEAAVAAGFCVGMVFSGGILAALAAAGAAFFVPELILRSKVRKKLDEILKEMPDAFDIIGANIEGGLSLNMAIARYSSRVKCPFASELMTVIKKIQLGKSFGQAMRELDEKLSIKELSGFVNAFIQADIMGGNVREIIKNQATEIRQKRFQYLKKKAHEAPVKLLLPLMLFIFPVIFIVLFAPIVIKLMQGL